MSASGREYNRIERAMKTGVVDRQEAMQILSAIARGEHRDEKQTSRGDTIQIPPSARDKIAAINLMGRIEGWVYEDDGPTESKAKVGILKPASKAS
jgi:hypothetical protein